MYRQIGKIQETLQNPDIVVKSKIDIDVELFLQKLYKYSSRREIFIKCIIYKIRRY